MGLLTASCRTMRLPETPEWMRFHKEKKTRVHTVKAVPTVNWLPRITYTKNAVHDTKIGAVDQIKEKHTELTRAAGK